MKKQVIFVDPLEKRFFRKGAGLPDNNIGCSAEGKLAGELEKYGISTEVIRMFNHVVEEASEKVEKLDPKVVAFSVLTLSFWRVKELAEDIKGRLPEVKIVLGGYHMNTVPEDIIKSEAFDYAVLGYGEIPFRRLVQRLLAGDRNVDDIAGLVIRDPLVPGGFRRTAKQVLPAVENFTWAKRDWETIRESRCEGLFYPPPSQQGELK
ncbi:MAG: cobalamin-dependent protein [bacterium]